MSASLISNGIRDSGTPKLVRQITFFHAVCLMVGTVIGSGIFVSPVSIISHCHSVGLSLVVWLCAGIVTILAALCYVELACLLRTKGGEYEFHKKLLPYKLPAFLIAWMRFIMSEPIFHALLALTTSQYLFKPLFSDCLVPQVAAKVTAILILGKLFLHIFK